jgi:hypothetical protein
VLHGFLDLTHHDFREWRGHRLEVFDLQASHGQCVGQLLVDRDGLQNERSQDSGNCIKNLNVLIPCTASDALHQEHRGTGFAGPLVLSPLGEAARRLRGVFII